MVFYKKTQTVSTVLQKSIEQRDNFLKKFLSFVEQYNHIVLFMHNNPDGDGIGGILGLKQVLKNRFSGKKIYAIGNSEEVYPWLNMEFDTVPPQFDLSKALAIVIDVGTSERICEFNQFFKRPDRQFGAVIKIDHHGTKSDFSIDLEWDDNTYASSCCQLVQICEYFGWEISPKAATYFYIGISTDTGSFKYDCVLPRTHVLAAKLLRCKADFSFVNRNLMNRSFKDIDVEQFILSKLQKGNSLLWYEMSLEDWKKIGVTPRTGFVNVIGNIENNIMWIAFTQIKLDHINVEFRSVGVSVRKIAVEFGGGGHEHAAGCVISTKEEKEKLLARAQELVDEYVKDHIHELHSSVVKISDLPQSESLDIESREVDNSKALSNDSKNTIDGVKAGTQDLVDAKAQYKQEAKDAAKAEKEAKKAEKEAKKAEKERLKAESKAAAEQGATAGESGSEGDAPQTESVEQNSDAPAENVAEKNATSEVEKVK